MSQSKVEFLWVNTPQALDYFITNLRGYFPIALDTEADSLHHYRESVCLIQVTHDSRHFLIDPLDDFPLDELWPPTSRHTWILHGADFDLRMLRRAGAPEPQAVFDTMLAAQLLGLKAFGYGALVEQFCGITLNKGSQKADWSRRPLSQTMIDYAVQDTEYLEPIAEALGAQLDEKGRRAWHEQSCARVVAASQIVREDDPENDWRISGSALLSPAGARHRQGALVLARKGGRVGRSARLQGAAQRAAARSRRLVRGESARPAHGRAALAAAQFARARRAPHRRHRARPPGAARSASAPRRTSRRATRTPRSRMEKLRVHRDAVAADLGHRSHRHRAEIDPAGNRPQSRHRRRRASSPRTAGAPGSGSC